jgi:hypothetical protein
MLIVGFMVLLPVFIVLLVDTSGHNQMFKLSQTRFEIWWILFPMRCQFVRRDSRRRPARRLTVAAA